MSTFTQFSAGLDLVKDKEASKILGKEYRRVKSAFRYYVGHYGSDTWVDVPEGMLTDGATVPWPFNKLIPPYGEYSQAVVLHDRLCDTYKVTRFINGNCVDVPVTRLEIDNIFNEAMGVLKVKTWRRVVIMIGVDAYRCIANPKKPVVNKRKKALEDAYVLTS